MKYERRSILDKNKLLVDVKLPSNELDDQEEDEYLKSFQLHDLDKRKESQHRVFANLVDEEEDDEEDEDDEIIEEVFEIQTYEQIYKPPNEKQEALTDEEREEDYEMRFKRNSSSKQSHKYYAPAKPSQINVGVEDYEEEDDESFLPDESMPSLSNVTDMNSSNDEAFISSTSGLFKANNNNNKVLKRRVKARPSLLDYYGDAIDSKLSENLKETSQPKSGTKRYQQNDQDIDETFDFLDEELYKYDK